MNSGMMMLLCVFCLYLNMYWTVPQSESAHIVSVNSDSPLCING